MVHETLDYFKEKYKFKFKMSILMEQKGIVEKLEESRLVIGPSFSTKVKIKI